jgi:hypothetical protein
MSNANKRHEILIEGLTPDEVLALPEEYFAALASAGPVVFKAGSAEILGQLHLWPGRMMIELAQVDGGGEGALPTLSVLVERLARQRRIPEVEWVVHAINCAAPNLKLRRVLVKRGFVARDIEGIGSAYHWRQSIGST